MASLISAVAAGLAAFLAAANLYYSGRRERQRWVRETSVDLLISYLDASFAWSRAALQRYERRAAESDAELQRVIEQAHADQDAGLTKLRMMAGRAMVDAAFELHAANHAYEQQLTASPPPGDVDIQHVREKLWEARYRFIGHGKRTIGLPRDQSRVTVARGRVASEESTAGTGV